MTELQLDPHPDERTKMPDVAPKSQLSIRPIVEHFGLAGPAVQKIRFLHPGYPDNENVLLIFPALDSGGIHHGTARVACAILAKCKWEGYFSTTRDGPRITLDMDEILTNPIYYFRIDGDADYAITPSFDNFTFPETLPDYWREAPI
ncbi:hypothetical protein P170DRAFT_420594 [Aspergillus steynii IBT 23096]|uniref:Uncharacterized protein n=1 Tax=Aspergillus steynii IBT 23096 TaxID=1392250 RepID=A0A2I2GLN4_9EURO|nr:uncharacterized protein P170DRAFT_420594 [Aspergillus steynii IBT 23096]PLB53784.1 hypothetical protein P170DRAFT_420594 [Aspergillus steynii IBT 23096]